MGERGGEKMILQALYEYYQRKAADPESKTAPEGFEWKEIPFVIVIDATGKFVDIEDTREGEGEKKKAKSFLVPAAEKRTTGVKANLLWDNVEYALGANPRGRDDIDLRKKAFLDRLKRSFKDEPSVTLASPLVGFLEQNPIEQINTRLPENAVWKEAFETNSNILFRISGAGDTSLCDTLRPYIKSSEEVGKEKTTCLITGKNDTIARLHASIKGVRGAQSSGASLVSFNLNAFESYGKRQNYNSPVGNSAAFGYTTALNMLLGKNSKNRVQVGDASVVFWSQKQDAFEDAFPAFFQFPQKDNPDADVRAVKALYDGVFTGSISAGSERGFCVLGLSPNAARISVRFWHQGTISEFAAKIRQHFDDLEIVRSPKDIGRYSLFWILSAMAHEGKVDNVPPNLSGQIFQSVITGGLYPVTMLQQVIRRIRTTQAKDLKNRSIQASILKAYLNRFSRIYKTKAKEITVALDSTNDNPGYRLGRLFAVLERVQERGSSTTLNSTIRDRFYGAASSTPVTVFPQLLKLKNHHLAKVDEKFKNYYEHLIGEIVAGLGGSMPAHLSMEDQARFAIGYYHQRQDFFKKKDSDNDNENKGE